jgi:hypothetical protein
LVRDPSLLPSNWADRHSNLHQDQAPSPLSVLQRSALSQDQDDLEHVKPSEQTAVSSEHETALEANAQTETAEGSSTPPDAEASSAPPEAVSAESAPAEAEASADTGDTAQAGEESVSSEDAAGVAEAQASPEVQVEAQKEGSSEAAPTEGASTQATEEEAASEPAQEASSEPGPSAPVEESASNEAAPEPAALSEQAEASTSSEPESQIEASSESAPEPASSSEAAPAPAPEPVEEPTAVQASAEPGTSSAISTEEPDEATDEALNVQALSLQASASPTTSRSSTPDTTLATDVRSLSGGQPLAPSLRSELESFHKADLGNVQTFVNPDLTARVQARAFTTGEKIVFNNAGDLENRELIAHETAHVKQQALGEVSGSSIAPGVKLSDPSDAFEREASSLGSSFARQPKQLQTSPLESSTATPSSTPVSRDSRALSQTVFSNTASSSVQRQPNTSTNTPIQRWGLGDAWDWVKDKASDAWGGLKNLVSKGWDWVKDKASAALVFVLETISKAFGSTGARIVEVLKSVGSAIMGILQNPGAFISNLIAGVKTGFMNFATNAKSHLSGILGQWLTGNSGVQFPTKFEPLEILQSILSTVGASWNNLRGKITSKLGPGSDKAIAIAEKSVPLVSSLAKGQFHNLEDVKAQVLPAVKTEAVEGLKDGVRDTVLKQGAITLLSRLNPAGGLITIFKTVQFLIEKASSIASFVSSVWGGLTNIAKGDVGGAAAKVEQSLVSGVSLALNFLSKQIGLDGIVKKVQAVVHSISSKVNKVLEVVAGKAVKLVQPILDKIKGGVGAAKQAVTNTSGTPGTPGTNPAAKSGTTTSEANPNDKDHDLKVQKGLSSIPSLEQKYIKEGGLTKEDAQRIAQALKQQNPIFKSVTPAFNGNKIEYHWVASSGVQSSSAGLVTLKLDLETVREELWGGRKRPSWVKSTKLALAAQYPDKHELDASGKPTGKVINGNDRRHIESFDHMVIKIVNELNHAPLDDASSILEKRGYKPKGLTLGAILQALKQFLAKEFNEVSNLFVDDGVPNQALGNQYATSETAREKAVKAGDDAEFDKQSDRLAQATMDVPKGMAGGKDLTARENGYISEIDQRYGVTYTSLTKALVLEIKEKRRLPSAEYTAALNDLRALNLAVRSLAAFSKTGSSAANQAIDSALKKAAYQQRLISEILNG